MNEIRPHSFLIHINDENLILYVDSNNATGIEDGSEDYPYNTITEAVEAATSVPRGHIDEIHVHPGLYSAARGEDTNPRARVALKGGGASNTIIEGLIELTVEDEFSGFTGRNTRWLNVCLDTVIHHNVFYTSCIIVDDPYGIQIINNTIVDCDNGISVAGPAEESIIKNNIFAFNNTALSLYDSESIGTFDITYNDFWENGADCATRREGLILDMGGRDGNISSNPLFIDQERVDYHLKRVSPCIDRGDPENPLDPDRSRADMGPSITIG